MSAEVKSMKEWALYYAELGLAVFPLAYRNKVPAIEGGCKAATTEKSKIERWWNQNPRYNIGIATGNKSNGLVVIDLDVDKNKGIDGYEVLRDWQNKHGELPETWQSITGRGGYHYFYKDTITHSNKVGLYEGVDIRGEGGYIVAPPSVHPNGNTYEWEQEPKEYEIAQVDDIVNDFFKGEKQRIDSEHKTNFKVPELIPEGKRVDTIVRLIASLRTKGLDDDAIKAAVRVENEKRCNPPLKEKELEKAVFPALKRDWQVKTSKNTNQAAKNTKKANKETEGYLSTLDEIQRYTSNKNDDSVADGNSIGDTGGYTAPTPAQMFKKVPVANSIKGIADKIKKLIKSEDWEGLGKYIASGINKGLKKVYEAISWKKVGPKITKFCDAFTRTFNSLVDNVDWKLLGRTVGAGINTIVNTLNLLITGIDWKNLGKKFAEGITGLVKEVNWNNLGQLIANRFMITWDIFNGMVHNLPFSEIGKAIADGLNGICSRISFREIADTLATGLNGAFTTLYSFTRRFDWTGLVNNIAGGINTFISEFDWKNNGRKLEVFLNSLCSSLVDMAEKTDWEALGQGIGEMLGQINWVKHLKQVITAITRTLGGLFDVLEASGTAGKIAAFLGKAFIAVKIADITGIGSLVKFLVTTIGKKLITEESVQALAGRNQKCTI